MQQSAVQQGAGHGTTATTIIYKENDDVGHDFPYPRRVRDIERAIVPLQLVTLGVA